MREAPVPAQQPEAQEDPRFSRPHAHSRRPGGHQVPAPARPHPAVGLTQIPPVRDRATFDALSRARRRSRGLVTMRFVPSGETPRVAIATSRGTGRGWSQAKTRKLTRDIARCIVRAGGTGAATIKSI